MKPWGLVVKLVPLRQSGAGSNRGSLQRIFQNPCAKLNLLTESNNETAKRKRNSSVFAKVSIFIGRAWELLKPPHSQRRPELRQWDISAVMMTTSMRKLVPRPSEVTRHDGKVGWIKEIKQC